MTCSYLFVYVLLISNTVLLKSIWLSPKRAKLNTVDKPFNLPHILNYVALY